MKSTIYPHHPRASDIQVIPFCKLLIFRRISAATVSIRTENAITIAARIQAAPN
jgi:hypothetical protein